MPLLKLWNAIRGRSNAEQPTAERADQAAETRVASKSSAKSSKAGFSLFGGKTHGGLLKKIAKTGARSVLEISVGDGSRAVAVVETLGKKGVPIRYFGIDQFELGGGEVSLMDFHRTLRSAGIQAQLFPEDLDRGLVRFLHTIGTVDLVLIAEPVERLQEEQIRQLLSRISHGETTILYRQDESWVQFSTSPATMRRAA